MNDSAAKRARRTRTAGRLAGAGLLLAAGVLLWRGPLSVPAEPYDFTQVYVATRAWLAGGDVYDLATRRAVWREAPGTTGSRRDAEALTALYPPGLYPLLGPAAALPFPWAVRAWTAVGGLSVVALVVAGWRLAGVRPASIRGLALAAALCLLAPIQTNFRLGQLGLPATALVMLGLWAGWSGRRWAVSGLVLGLAVGLKPQLSLPFVLYVLLRGGWREAGVAVAVAAGLTGLGAARLWLAGVDWPTGLAAELAAFTDGGHGDPMPANPHRWQMIDLAPLTHLAIEHRGVAAAVVWGLVAGLAAAAWLAVPRRGDRPTELTVLGLVAALSLLVVYHRFYDAVLLALPVCALLCGWRRRHRIVAILAVGLLLPFAVNLPAAVRVFGGRVGWVSGLVESPFGRWVALPVYTWCLLGLALLAVGVLSRRRGAERGADDGP
ncbi:MAG: glycosyltransferase family 87 protein [Planctomycetota bacterium]